MLSQHENIKVGVARSLRTASPQRVERANRHSALHRIVSTLLAPVNHRETVNEILGQLAIPASLLLFLTVPALLLCASGKSLVGLLFVLPILGLGIVGGLLLFRHRAKEERPFPSIVKPAL
jgi:hypothetical protein